MINLFETLKDIFNILQESTKLNLNKFPIQVINSQVITLIGDISSLLLNQKSKLPNNIEDLEKLKTLLLSLYKNNFIIRLNHIGFGYNVKSQKEERQRLIELVKKTNQYLYEEESNDFGLWLFLGNTANWEKPLIEFVPVEQDHPTIDYFLPHIQIDIDTKLNSKELTKLINNIFHNKIKLIYLAVFKDVPCIVRFRLGVIDGVNIFLDLATNSRKVEYHRKNLLKKIS